MHKRNSFKPAPEAETVVHRVDPVNRELAVFVEGVVVNLDVPPDCAITLRGERVKLRMVQPGDRVRVTYAERAGALVARALDVQSAYPLSSLSS